MTDTDRQLVDKLYSALTGPERLRPEVDTLTRTELERLICRLKEQAANEPTRDTWPLSVGD